MTQTKRSDTPINTGRRDLLMGATAITAALATGATFASGETMHNHDHQTPARNTALIDAALDCIKKANACNDHCIELVKQGDTSIADCLSSVAVALPMCNALSTLASSKSKHLAEMAKVCISVCEDCYEECKKHQKHIACKECMDSCAVCIEECNKVLA